MRKILLVLLLLPSMIFAASVDPNIAKQIAENFINSTQADSTSGGVYQAPRKQKRLARQNVLGETNPYYIFNSEDGEGFVIVSADDVATPILGYSTEGQIDTEDLPIQLKELLSAYSEEIQSAIDNNMQATDSVKNLWNNYKNSHLSLSATTVVNALISTSWNQYPYYNIKCPSDPSLSSKGGHPTTGCVATAMAQIMKYWEYPQTGIGNKTYRSQRYGTLSANFAITTYDWANMPLKLSSSTSSTQNNAVATLMSHCGIAVSMNYNSDGVGSSSALLIDYGDGSPCAERALKTYFGYSPTIAGKLSSSMTTAAWKTMLKTELDNQRPVLYAGFSPGEGGHAFICDGYDSNDNFHFNWGWGGQANGFFSLSALTPGSSNYTNSQQAVIGIKPADGSYPAKNYDLYMNTDLTAINTTSSSSSTEVNPYNFGSTMSFTARVENNGTGIFNGSFKVAAFTNDGEFIAWSNESYHFSLGVGSNTVLKTYTFNGGIPFVPGKYRAYMYYQDDDETACKLVKSDEGVILTEYNNVAFTVKSTGDLQPVSDFNVILGGFTTGCSRIRIEVDVKNTALLTTFYGSIRLCLYDMDGTRVKIFDELDYSSGFSSSSTKTLSFLGALDGVEPGSYYLALTYKKTDQTSWYYMGCNSAYPNPIKIDVTAPPLIADQYEENNTQATVTTLNWEIDPELPDFSTLQVSLHEDSDIDYYKLPFPYSKRYTINIALYDKHNPGGQGYMNADAQFAYSIGKTNAYTDYYKYGQTISFIGPTTLYIRVKPFGMDGLGYYELSGEIEESVIDAIDDIENSIMDSPRKTIQDGHLYITMPNGSVYDILGQRNK